MALKRLPALSLLQTNDAGVPIALAVHRRGGVVLHLLDGREPVAHGSEGVQPTLLMGNVSCPLSGASVAAAAAHHLNATLERWWRTELRAESHHFCPYVLVESLTPRLLARPGRSGVSRPFGVWRQTRTLQTPLLES